jgi:hypothetical protein
MLLSTYQLKEKLLDPLKSPFAFFPLETDYLAFLPVSCGIWQQPLIYIRALSHKNNNIQTSSNVRFDHFQAQRACTVLNQGFPWDVENSFLLCVNPWCMFPQLNRAVSRSALLCRSRFYPLAALKWWQ